MKNKEQILDADYTRMATTDYTYLLIYVEVF